MAGKYKAEREEDQEEGRKGARRVRERLVTRGAAAVDPWNNGG